MAVKQLGLSYESFKTNSVMNPTEVNINNSEIKQKVNEVVGVLNEHSENMVGKAEVELLHEIKASKDDVYTKSELSDGALDNRYFRNEYALPTLQDYAEKFDGVAKQLTNIENANAKEKLSFLNPYGNDQNIHPKVLDFGKLWNGHRYWMAYTPFPYGSDKQENPCIAVSTLNVPTEWKTITVLDESPMASGRVDWNADTHLVYREDTNELECWWKYQDNGRNLIQTVRRKTTDGKTWSGIEVLDTATLTEQVMSPAVIFEGGIYKIWYSDGVNVCYEESLDGKDWHNKRVLNINADGIGGWWHLDVIKTDLGYEFALQGIPASAPSAEYGHMYHTKSVDNIHFETPKLILKPSQRVGAFDNQGIYRSSLLKSDGIYYLFYSGFAKDNTKGLGLTSGKTVDSLMGSISKSKHLSDIELIEFAASYIRDGRFRLSDGQNAVSLKPDVNNSLRLTENETEKSAALKVKGLVIDTEADSTSFGGKGAIKFNQQTGSLEFSDGQRWIPLTLNTLSEIIVKSITAGSSSLSQNKLKLSNGIIASVLSVFGDGVMQVKKDSDGSAQDISVGMLHLNGTTSGEGSIRYNQTSKKFQGSDGSAWHDLH